MTATTAKMSLSVGVQIEVIMDSESMATLMGTVKENLRGRFWEVETINGTTLWVHEDEILRVVA